MTFRKPWTMEWNVEEATKTYSNEQEETNLVYPTYEESLKRFKKAHKTLKSLDINLSELDEHSPVEERVEFVKAFQELSNAYEALVTYDNYNDDMEASKALREQVMTIEENIGIYNTIKGSLVEEGTKEKEEETPNFSDIEFYGENSVKLYDIDSAFI